MPSDWITKLFCFLSFEHWFLCFLSGCFSLHNNNSTKKKSRKSFSLSLGLRPSSRGTFLDRTDIGANHDCSPLSTLLNKLLKISTVWNTFINKCPVHGANGFRRMSWLTTERASNKSLGTRGFCKREKSEGTIHLQPQSLDCFWILKVR